MSEKAELWHNLLELSGIHGNDYYIWSACQAEVQGLFNSCDLKIAPGLRNVHKEQMIGQNRTLADMEKALCLKR